MKPKYWNKGKLYLSNKDKVLKKIIDEFPNQSLQLNNNSFQALLIQLLDNKFLFLPQILEEEIICFKKKYNSKNN